ncbi:hypothetical protein KIN20_027506 [Parelaphostrongylus tenuis]|uniref:Uncharacterized protein n=1 Tax=Parelaphostrongylus tenuis TaxID=148309 RepID=A0AAD5QZI4_PARTN|nr:hypothetical protein KIN20_027506 [Parelaphostrongylus tenuis]
MLANSISIAIVPELMERPNKFRSASPRWSTSDLICKLSLIRQFPIPDIIDTPTVSTILESSGALGFLVANKNA